MSARALTFFHVRKRSAPATISRFHGQFRGWNIHYSKPERIKLPPWSQQPFLNRMNKDPGLRSNTCRIGLGEGLYFCRDFSTSYQTYKSELANHQPMKRWSALTRRRRSSRDNWRKPFSMVFASSADAHSVMRRPLGVSSTKHILVSCRSRYRATIHLDSNRSTAPSRCGTARTLRC